MVTLRRWNILEHLHNEEEIAGYLEAAITDIEEGECDSSFFPLCLADAAKARAINQLAKETGIDRKIFCDMFLEDSDARTKAPEISTDAIKRVTRAFAVPVQV